MTDLSTGSDQHSPKPIDPASTILQIVVPQSVEAVVRSLPDPAAWLQRVIIEAANQELLASSTLNVLLQADPTLVTSNPLAHQVSRSKIALEPAELPIGCLVRNPLRWLGHVKTYDPQTGRYLVTFQNGIDRDFPRHLLTFVAPSK